MGTLLPPAEKYAILHCITVILRRERVGLT